MDGGHQRATAVSTEEGMLQLRCECGWVSPPGVTAEQVGAHWDEHIARGDVDLR